MSQALALSALKRGIDIADRLWHVRNLPGADHCTLESCGLAGFPENEQVIFALQDWLTPAASGTALSTLGDGGRRTMVKRAVKWCVAFRPG